MKKKLTLLTTFLLCFASFAAFGQNTRTYEVEYAQDGFKGYAELKVDLFTNGDFSCVSFNIKTTSKVVINSYENGKYNQLLAKKGITFPHTIQAKSFSQRLIDLSAQAYFYSSPQMRAIAAYGAVRSNLSVDDSRGCAAYDANFSEADINYLKDYYKNHNANLWALTGKLGQLTVQHIYFDGFDHQVKKVIDDAEKEERAKEQAEKEEASSGSTASSSSNDNGTTSNQTNRSNTASESSSERGSNDQETDTPQKYVNNTEETASQRQARIIQEQQQHDEQERQRKAQLKQEYDQQIKEQNDKNIAAAGAAAAGAAGLLYYLGGFIYKGMGDFSPSAAYSGGNLFLGMDFGYGMSLTPVFFNSKIISMNNDAEYVKKSEVVNWSPLLINMNLQLKFGYEHDYFGGFIFGQFIPGSSIVFQSFELSGYYGMRAFAGIRNIKVLFGYTGGGRKVMIKPWLNAEEAGRGMTKIKSNDILLGLRFSWNYDSFDAARHHLSIGVLWDGIKDRKDNDKELGYYYIRNIHQESGNQGLNKKNVGVFFEWKHDHYSVLSLRIFPKFPTTGYYTGTLNKEDFKKDKNYPYFQISFTRAIDRFY